MQTPAPTLNLNPDVAFAILLKLREFDVKVEQTDPDSGSNPSDDQSVDALEFGSSDAIEATIYSAINDLNDDEQRELIALIWLGRGDFSLVEWSDALLAARDIGRTRLPRYVRGIPLVSDFMEEGLSLFNETIEDYLDRS